MIATQMLHQLDKLKIAEVKHAAIITAIPIAMM